MFNLTTPSLIIGNCLPLQTVRILNSQTHGPWHAFVTRITFNSLMRDCKTINFTMNHYWWEVPKKMLV